MVILKNENTLINETPSLLNKIPDIKTNPMPVLLTTAMLLCPISSWIQRRVKVCSAECPFGCVNENLKKKNNSVKPAGSFLPLF
jgi:hypothetical protein